MPATGTDQPLPPSGALHDGGLATTDTVAIFVSDVHLNPAQPRTLAAFFTFLQQYASKTQYLFLLGDLFEYWAGDDDIPDPCNHSVVKALRAVSQSGVKLFWLPGNRDFLVGASFARATGATLLAEPHVQELAGRTFCLIHGDAECTDDTAYMAFRARVRAPAWQQQFLTMPLSQRKTIIEGMRQGSREQQKLNSMQIMDVNAQAIAARFAATGCATLIHGHTHRPALHHYPGQLTRHVLPDWDADSEPARGGFIALGHDGVLRHLGLHGELLRA